jgi:hypothetical protein
LAAGEVAAVRIGVRDAAPHTVGMDDDRTEIEIDDRGGLLAQLVAVAALELAACLLVPNAVVWAS